MQSLKDIAKYQSIRYGARGVKNQNPQDQEANKLKVIRAVGKSPSVSSKSSQDIKSIKFHVP